MLAPAPRWRAQLAFGFVASLPRARRRRAYRRVELPPREQTVLPMPLPMPATVAECREAGPIHDEIQALGMCPIFRCRHNLALWVKSNGSIKVEAGHVSGATMRHSRPARDAKLDAMADLAIALGDRLGTLCVLDLVPDDLSHLLKGDGGVHMTFAQIAAVLGCNKEMARVLVEEAEHAKEIEEKRRLRAAQRARQDAQLVQIRRKPSGR